MTLLPPKIGFFRAVLICTLILTAFLLTGCTDMPPTVSSTLQLWTNILFGVAVLGGLGFFIFGTNDHGGASAGVGFISLIVAIILTLLLVG